MAYPNTSTSSTPHSIAKTRQASGFITCTVPSHVKELFSGFYSIEEKSSFTYIDDAVQGLIYAYGSHKRLVNVANMQPITVKSFAEIVGSYKSIDIELVETTREHDNSEQVVDRYIFLVPLSYTSVENGIRKIFAGRRNQTPQNSKTEEG